MAWVEDRLAGESGFIRPVVPVVDHSRSSIFAALGTRHTPIVGCTSNRALTGSMDRLARNLDDRRRLVLATSVNRDVVGR
ncbi:hypothetical protein [Nocardia tengchongensis]|uniref:hypothetical protein n=1 Tax=Nocardia tengchongensis TaxID=2055889 RepID=UPI0036820BED